MEKETVELTDDRLNSLRKSVDLYRVGHMLVRVGLVDSLLEEIERLRDFEAKVKEIAATEERDEWHAAELLDQIRKVVGKL